MPIINTPNTATKNEDFTDTQTTSYKTELDLTGIDAYELTTDSGFKNATIELLENFMYTFYTDLAISDGQTIKDSEANEYTVFVYNEPYINSDEPFEVNIIDDIAYLYPLNN